MAAFPVGLREGLGDAMRNRAAELGASQRTSASTAGGAQVELAALRERIKQLESDAKTKTFELDPKDIALSPLANRNEMAYLSEDFSALCKEIESTGGNVQPVGVTRINNRWTLIFGHRRRRACMKLGVKVRAFEIPDLSDMQLLMKYMHAENAERADLSVFEQGQWFKTALSQGVFKNALEMAAVLNISVAWVSKALAVANLPSEIIKAFPNPLGITSKMGDVLHKAMKENEAEILQRAEQLQEPREDGATYTANEVFMRLLYEGGVTRAEEPRPMRLAARAKPYGKINRDAKGRIQLVLDEKFTRSDMKALEEFVLQLAQDKEYFQPKVKKPRKAKAVAQEAPDAESGPEVGE